MVIAMIIATSASPALPQSRGGQPPIIKDLVNCTRIVDDNARLQCFDRSAKQLNIDLEEHRITVLDGESIKETRRSLFGFQLPSVGLFEKTSSDAKEEITNIDGVIARITPLANQRFELVLKDGARWQTTEAANDPFDVGDNVHIRRAALGSYWIAGGHGRTLRGRRVG